MKQLMIVVGILVAFVIVCSLETQPDSRYESNISHKPKEPQVKLEIRICIKEVDIKTGPGEDYEMNEAGQLHVSERIFILTEEQGWLKFRCTPNDVGWHGWVKKAVTVPEAEWEHMK